MEASTAWKGQLERHSDPLTMLRGVLALAIIWHHLQWEPIASMTLGGVNIFFLVSFPGRISVWLFLVVSGYSIYHGYRTGKYSFDREDTLRFYFNRAVRILPLLYVTVLLKWLLMLYLYPKDLPPFAEIAGTLLLLNPNMVDGIYTFTPVWVIAILVQFYILAPFLVKGWLALATKAGPGLSAAALVVIAVACHYLGGKAAGSYDIRNIVGCVPFFLFGFLACDLLRDRSEALRSFARRIPPPLAWVAVLVLFEASFFLYGHRYDKFMEWPIETLIGSLGALVVVLLLVGEQDSGTGTSTGRVAKLLGPLGQQSHGLYMWHGIVIALFIRRGILPLAYFPHATLGSLVKTFLAVSILTYLVSVLFYHILERPYHLLYRDAKR